MKVKYDVGDLFKCNQGYGVCITTSQFILITEIRKGKKFANRLAEIPKDSVPVHEKEPLQCERSIIFTLKCIAMTARACSGTLNNFNSIEV